MVDRDSVIRRLFALREALDNLERHGHVDATTLAQNSLLRAGIERWLQVAIEACIDVACHQVVSAGWTPPDTAGNAFALLAAHQQIPLELGNKLKKAAGLRNLLVHDYVNIDLELLVKILEHDLQDLRKFATLATTWV